jgi:NADH-quinone oxidoreductase subunit N
MASNDHHMMVVFGIGMVLVGLGFKAALVPFHQWTPDVYQGAPTNVTGFMAAASKIAAFGALVRVLAAAAPVQEIWFPAMVGICILTMTVANLAALVQKDVKRVLGYSSIANAGYILVAVLAHFKAPDKVPLTTTLYYLMAYSLMTLGAFAVIGLAAKGGKEGSRFRDLHGLWNRAPFAVACLVVFVASLIGIPPSAGFVGKLLIFNDALAAGLPVLAIALAVNSVISVYYYLGIVQATFVSDEGAVSNVAGTPVNLHKRGAGPRIEHVCQRLAGNWRPECSGRK